MRALDKNVLARFFVDDTDDAQAAEQRPAAVAALSERSFVSVTVLLDQICLGRVDLQDAEERDILLAGWQGKARQQV